MIERECEIKNLSGMHARPATLFVEQANRSRCSISVRKGDIEVNGKSILGVMMLCAGIGESIIITARGDSLEDEEKIINELCNLIDNRFHEEESA